MRSSASGASRATSCDCIPRRRDRGRVTIRDLFKATLRMRPDRIVVGEIRSGEALELIQAMTSGHGGCLSTVHATYPIDTLNRLETMCLMSDIEMPLSAMRAQIASAVDIIVQTSRLRDGSRCVTHISEVQGYSVEKQTYIIEDVFIRLMADAPDNFQGGPKSDQVESDLGLSI